MRPLAVLIMLIALLPGAVGQTATSGSVGVAAGPVSAGLWHIYEFDVIDQGPTTHVVLELWWAASLAGADYDLTLYRPGALDDGTLSNHEVIASSWTRGVGARQERIEIDLPSNRYVITVEAIHATNERYWLDATPGYLHATFPGAVGTKLG